MVNVCVPALYAQVPPPPRARTFGAKIGMSSASARAVFAPTMTMPQAIAAIRRTDENLLFVRYRRVRRRAKPINTAMPDPNNHTAPGIGTHVSMVAVQPLLQY